MSAAIPYLRRLLALPWVVASTALAVPAGTERFLERYCLDCHDEVKPKAGLDLYGLKFDPADPRNLATWTHVYDRIAAGQMPPEDEDQPSAADLEAFLQSVDAPLLGAWKERYQHQGRTVGRRLNPLEYEHTLRDLLGAPWLEIKEMLPPDPSVGGFDNVAEGQELSYIQMARYLEAAGIAIDRAVLLRPEPETTTVRTWFTEKGRYLAKRDKDGKKIKPADVNALEVPEWVDFHSQPNSAQAPRRIKNSSPRIPGWYKFRARCRAIHKENGEITPPARGQVAWINTDAKRILGTLDVPQGEEGGIVEFTAWQHEDEGLEFHCATVGSSRGKGPSAGDAVGIGWFEIEGPFATKECVAGQWPAPGYQVLFGDLPMAGWTKDSGLREPLRLHVPDVSGGKKGGSDPFQFPAEMTMVVSAAPEEDAARLLRGFMERAYRRPVDEVEFQRCLAFATGAIREKFCFQDAMRLAYKSVLCSPDFLYLIERPGRLDHFALASRLSYLLWRSMPDAALLRSAAEGKLGSDAELLAQFERMLADPKADRFVGDFVGQWLDLGAAHDTAPDPDLYPEYYCDTHVVLSAVGETEATFAKMLKEDLPVSTVIDSDFVMVNERLARLYGLDGVEGRKIREVPLPSGSPRGGLITQASVLKVTANGLATSPVLRGVWLLDRILGTPQPPPPPDAGAIDPDTRGTTTVREQLAKHATDKSCASCHAHIDPPGFALESFDVMGAFRERYRSNSEGERPPEQGVKYKLGPVVDASGRTAEGDVFDGIDGFRRYLLGKEDRIVRSLVERLITFSTGATVTYADRGWVDGIMRKTEPSGHGLRSILREIVISETFRSK